MLCRCTSTQGQQRCVPSPAAAALLPAPTGRRDKVRGGHPAAVALPQAAQDLLHDAVGLRRHGVVKRDGDELRHVAQAQAARAHARRRGAAAALRRGAGRGCGVDAAGQVEGW